MAKQKKKKTTVKKRQKRSFFYRTDWHVLAGLLLFTVVTLLTRPEEATALEEAIFNFFYVSSGVLVPFFFVITQLGSIHFLALLALLYLFLKRYVIMLRLLMAGALAYLLTGVGKDLFGRGRPDELFGDVAVHDYVVRGPGYPSGHTAMAVAIGVVLYRYCPKKWRIPIVTLTFLAAISRMSVGVHTPLDILGGAAIGYLSAMLFERVELRERTNGK